MRKIALLSLGILFSIMVISQEYHQLINESLYWDVSFADQGYICTGFGSSIPKRYKFSGDTMINGNIYARFYRSTFINLYTPPAPNCPPFEIDTVFSLNCNYFIREDTIERKVWRYMENSYPEETLLFDFSKEQGDTLSFEGSPDIIIDTVYNIVTDDGLTRKKIEWEPEMYSFGGFYIEGLGGAAGPFGIPYFVYGYGLWLMCVKDNENNTIWSNYSECYDFITFVPSVKNDFSIQISPNPAIKTITIQSSPKTKIKEIKIYTQTGQKFLIQKAPINTIDISDLKPGLYFVEIATDMGIVIEKLIVQ